MFDLFDVHTEIHTELKKLSGSIIVCSMETFEEVLSHPESYATKYISYQDYCNMRDYHNNLCDDFTVEILEVKFNVRRDKSKDETLPPPCPFESYTTRQKVVKTSNNSWRIDTYNITTGELIQEGGVFTYD